MSICNHKYALNPPKITCAAIYVVAEKALIQKINPRFVQDLWRLEPGALSEIATSLPSELLAHFMNKLENIYIYFFNFFILDFEWTCKCIDMPFLPLSFRMLYIPFNGPL